MNQETNNPIRDFFKNPKIEKAVVDIVVRKKPVGWSRRSNAPYYKEYYAQTLKAQIDAMIADRKDRIFPYASFPQHSKQTLYLRINQSLRYIIDYMDDDNKTYAKWSEMVEITRERDVRGIRISYRPEFQGMDFSKEFIPVAIESRSQVPTWKQEVDDYLENSQPGDKPLHIDKLCMTPEQVIDLNTSLKPLEGIMYSVNAHEIKIIKTA